jgi:hypothetical protein
MADPLLGNLQNGGVGFAGLPRAGKDFPGLKQQVSGPACVNVY